MARPNLSALVSRYLFRETLSNDDKASLRGDINAETAGAAATAQSVAIATASSDATTKANAARDASQPLNANLTSYAGAADAAARRALIGALEATEAAILAEIGTDGRIKAELMPDNAATVNPESTIIVDPNGTDAERGVALVAAYTEAKALTPGGNALSATNRATVILPPGKYELTAFLLLDTSYVDIVALIPENPSPLDPAEVHNLTGLNNPAYYKPQNTEVYTKTNGVYVRQTCADIRLCGFTLANLSTAPSTSTHMFRVAVETEEANAPSLYDKMYFYSLYTSYQVGSNGITGVAFNLHADGTWRDCVAHGCAWRLTSTENARFRAKMYDCQFGPRSIGGDVASGQITSARFERCKTVGLTSLGGNGESFGGCVTFGMPITSAAVFIECDGGDKSFAIGKECAGTFIRCRGGSMCFGGATIGTASLGGVAGIFSGVAEDCVAGGGSFGGHTQSTLGHCSGTLTRCVITGNNKTLPLLGAKIRGCRITVTTTDINALTLKDSDSVISDTDIIVVQGGTGIPINAASALNVSAYGCRMNNATNDADGLGTNVTNLVTSAGNVVSDAIT